MSIWLNKQGLRIVGATPLETCLQWRAVCTVPRALRWRERTPSWGASGTPPLRRQHLAVIYQAVLMDAKELD